MSHCFLKICIGTLSIVLVQQLQQSCWLYEYFVALKTFSKRQENFLNHLPSFCCYLFFFIHFFHFLLGDHCEKCSDGWYGNATNGTPEDCSPCPCPAGPNAMNQFARTCVLSNDGLPTCINCSAGHEGRYCDSCMDGYFGRPRVSGSLSESWAEFPIT